MSLVLFNDLVQQVLALQHIDNNTTRISIMYFVELLCVECFDEDYLQGIADDLSIIFDKFLSLNDKNVRSLIDKIIMEGFNCNSQGYLQSSFKLRG
jgi:hypothetical protein